MTVPVVLFALVFGWSLVEIGRFISAGRRLTRSSADATVDVATGLLARRHGIVRFRIELRRARRAERAVTLHEIRAPSVEVADAIGASLATTITYPDVALRLNPLEIVVLQSVAGQQLSTAPIQAIVDSAGCAVSTRAAAAAESHGFEQLERYADNLMSQERAQ